MSIKTQEYIRSIFNVVAFDNIIGRQPVMDVTGLKLAAPNLIKKLNKLDIIETEAGFGKGKYKFNNK